MSRKGGISERIIRHLDLLPDQTFQLRLTYLGKPQEQNVDDIGHWRMEGNLRVLRLVGGRKTHESFEVLDFKTLRKLDKEGKPIESTLNYDLEQSEVFAP